MTAVESHIKGENTSFVFLHWFDKQHGIIQLKKGSAFDLIPFWSYEMAKRNEKQKVDSIDNGLIPTVIPTTLKEKPIIN